MGTLNKMAAQVCKRDVNVLLDHGVNELNAENKDFPDLTERFTCDQIFENRQDLINWAKDTGKECGTIVVVTRSEKPTCKRTPRLFLCCERYQRNKGTCPFQLRGVNLCRSNDKWTVKVQCGRHNHQLASKVDGYLDAGQLKLDEFPKLSERLTADEAPDSDAENKDDFPDLSENFTTDQMFDSRKDLTIWAKETGKGCGTIVVVHKSETTCGRTPRLILRCERYHRKKGSCPFQLRAVYILGNDRWKVKVNCGRHNHQLASTDGHSYVDQLKLDLSERISMDEAPDVNVGSEDDFPDFSEKFTTSQTFESSQDLIDWAKNIGRGCGTVFFITKSENPAHKRTPNFFLSCERYNGNKGTCPFQLKGVDISDTNGKWKVEVHCGRHNHQLENPLDGCSYLDQLKPSEDKIVGQLTKRAVGLKHKNLIKRKSQPTKIMRRINTRKTLSNISIEQFWEITRPFIDDVHNVASDGHCGFRAVAAGLKMDSVSGWLTIREELIVELDKFKKEYRKIFGGEQDIKHVRSVLGCTKIPCPPECWFTIPTMGYLVASTYNVVFVYISHEDALTFVPLRSQPHADQLKVIAIGLVDGAHFVSIKLKRDCPIPQPVKVWTDRKIAKRWEDLLKNRIDAFKEIMNQQTSVSVSVVGDEVEPIVID